MHDTISKILNVIYILLAFFVSIQIYSVGLDLGNSTLISFVGSCASFCAFVGAYVIADYIVKSIKKLFNFIDKKSINIKL